MNCVFAGFFAGFSLLGAASEQSGDGAASWLFTPMQPGAEAKALADDLSGIQKSLKLTQRLAAKGREQLGKDPSFAAVVDRAALAAHGLERVGEGLIDATRDLRRLEYVLAKIEASSRSLRAQLEKVAAPELSKRVAASLEQARADRQALDAIAHGQDPSTVRVSHPAVAQLVRAGELGIAQRLAEQLEAGRAWMAKLAGAGETARAGVAARLRQVAEALKAKRQVVVALSAVVDERRQQLACAVGGFRRGITLVASAAKTGEELRSAAKAFEELEGFLSGFDTQLGELVPTLEGALSELMRFDEAFGRDALGAEPSATGKPPAGDPIAITEWLAAESLKGVAKQPAKEGGGL